MYAGKRRKVPQELYGCDAGQSLREEDGAEAEDHFLAGRVERVGGVQDVDALDISSKLIRNRIQQR